jgi:hypothetical protein
MRKHSFAYLNCHRVISIKSAQKYGLVVPEWYVICFMIHGDNLGFAPPSTSSSLILAYRNPSNSQVVFWTTNKDRGIGNQCTCGDIWEAPGFEGRGLWHLGVKKHRVCTTASGVSMVMYKLAGWWFHICTMPLPDEQFLAVTRLERGRIISVALRKSIANWMLRAR